MGELYPILILLAVAVFAVLAALRAKDKSTSGGNDHPYIKSGPLFTPAERSFFGVLQSALGKDAQVFGKVRVADVIKPAKGLTRSDWQRAFNAISSKHFDFVICRPDSLEIVCVVELNDRSHNSKTRKKRDELLERACRTARLPLIQVEAKSGYVIDDVRALLLPHLNDTPSSSSETAPKPTEAQPTTRACPKCESPLVKRRATKGKHAGREFLGCSAFPKCRHSETIET